MFQTLAQVTHPAGKFVAAALALAAGGYVLFYAFYCVKKGVVGAWRTPSITYRHDSPVYFWFCIALLVIAGVWIVSVGIRALLLGVMETL